MGKIKYEILGKDEDEENEVEEKVRVFHKKKLNSGKSRCFGRPIVS